MQTAVAGGITVDGPGQVFFVVPSGEETAKVTPSHRRSLMRGTACLLLGFLLLTAQPSSWRSPLPAAPPVDDVHVGHQDADNPRTDGVTDLGMQREAAPLVDQDDDEPRETREPSEAARDLFAAAEGNDDIAIVENRTSAPPWWLGHLGAPRAAVRPWWLPSVFPRPTASGLLDGGPLVGSGSMLPCSFQADFVIRVPLTSVKPLLSTHATCFRKRTGAVSPSEASWLRYCGPHALSVLADGPEVASGVVTFLNATFQSHRGRAVDGGSAESPSSHAVVALVAYRAMTAVRLPGSYLLTVKDVHRVWAIPSATPVPQRTIDGAGKARPAAHPTRTSLFDWVNIAVSEQCDTVPFPGSSLPILRVPFRCDAQQQQRQTPTAPATRRSAERSLEGPVSSGTAVFRLPPLSDVPSAETPITNGDSPRVMSIHPVSWSWHRVKKMKAGIGPSSHAPVRPRSLPAGLDGHPPRYYPWNGWDVELIPRWAIRPPNPRNGGGGPLLSLSHRNSFSMFPVRTLASLRDRHGGALTIFFIGDSQTRTVYRSMEGVLLNRIPAKAKARHLGCGRRYSAANDTTTIQLGHRTAAVPVVRSATPQRTTRSAAASRDHFSIRFAWDPYLDQVNRTLSDIVASMVVRPVKGLPSATSPFPSPSSLTQVFESNNQKLAAPSPPPGHAVVVLGIGAWAASFGQWTFRHYADRVRQVADAAELAMTRASLVTNFSLRIIWLGPPAWPRPRKMRGSRITNYRLGVFSHIGEAVMCPHFTKAQRRDDRESTPGDDNSSTSHEAERSRRAWASPIWQRQVGCLDYFSLALPMRRLHRGDFMHYDFGAVPFAAIDAIVCML